MGPGKRPGASNDELYRAFIERACDPIDISETPPIRLALFRQGNQGLLVVRVHHCLADGNGALQLVRLLGENIYADKDAALPEPLPMDRGFLQLFRCFKPLDYPVILAETVKELFRPLTLPFMKPLAQKPKRLQRTRGSLARLVIAGDDYRRIVERAREYKLTINDYMAAALLGMAEKFNRGLPRPSPYLAVAFTVNLRRFFKEEPVLITNISGIGSLMVRRPQALDFPTAARAARDRIGELKTRFPGLGFMLWPMTLAAMLPSSLIKKVTAQWIGFAHDLMSRGMTMSNVGAMDPFVEPFKHCLENASLIVPVFKAPFPVMSVSGCGQSLTVYFARLAGEDDEEDQSRLMAERMRYYLLEWP
jgi:NRPS condensation-like uncharacterized protein